MRKQPRDNLGRYAAFEGEKRQAQIRLRLTATEYEQLRRLARLRDMTMTEMLVGAVLHDQETA